MNAQLVSLLSDTLGLPAAAINEQTAMANTAAWDSIMHLNLCLSIESAFGLSLSPEEMLEMTSVPAIQTVLAQRGVA